MLIYLHFFFTAALMFSSFHVIFTSHQHLNICLQETDI